MAPLLGALQRPGQQPNAKKTGQVSDVVSIATSENVMDGHI